MLISIALIVSGTVAVSYEGFALDSHGRLYLGVYNKIDVYEGNSLLYSIDPQTQRTYSFTIQDDTILLSNTSDVYVIDLEGNIVSSMEDVDASIFNELQKNREFYSLDGNIYRMQKNFGRVRVIKENGEVIYQMPIFDYIVKMVIIFSAIGLSILVTYLVISFHKKAKIESR